MDSCFSCLPCISRYSVLHGYPEKDMDNFAKRGQVTHRYRSLIVALLAYQGCSLLRQAEVHTTVVMKDRKGLQLCTWHSMVVTLEV